MSRQRGPLITDADRRLWARERVRWMYYLEDIHLPLRLRKRLVLCDRELWSETKRSMGPTAMTGAFLTHGARYEQLDAADSDISSTEPRPK